MPVRITDVYGPQQEAFGKLTQALDRIAAAEVYIATGTLRGASWRKIVTAAARTRGGVRAVLNGFHGDSRAAINPVVQSHPRTMYETDAQDQLLSTFSTVKPVSAMNALSQLSVTN